MSNQLQALLKSNKINIVVDLDKDKSLSNIKSGLTQLTKDLDGFNIDLGVKFNPNVKELNKEIKALQTKISDSKSVSNSIKLDVEIDTSIEKLNNDIQKLQSKIQNAKTIKPIKLDVVIDVQGSAKKITEELGEIKGVLDKFKGDYSKALNNIKELGNSEFSDLLGDQTVRKLAGNVDNIKDYMRDAFGDGIISTKTIKDSENNIQALSATIKKETGEMYTSFFKLNDSGALELIKQEDVDNMEAQTAKAKRSINSLADEVEKVKSQLANAKSFDMFGKLNDQEFVSEKEVQNLKALVKAEKELILTNQKRKEFQDQLTRSMSLMSPEVSKVANEVKKLDVNLDKVDSNGLTNLSKQLKDLNTQYKSDEQVFNKRSATLKEINNLENRLATTYEKMAKTTSNLKIFNRANDLLTEAKATSGLTAEMKDLVVASNSVKGVQKELSNINLNVQLDAQTASMKRQVDSVEKTIRKLKEINAFDDNAVALAMAQLQEKMATSENSVKQFGQTLKTEYEKAREEQKALIDGFVLIERKTSDMKGKDLQGNIFKAIDNKDVTALKGYIGELKNGEVSTISMRDTLNSMGQAVTEVKVKMAGTGKTVEAYTFEMDKAGKSTDMMVKQTSSAFVDNENKALGFMEQMGIAMKRVPSWIISMQSFYAVINGFKSVGKEIMDIDAELIEIRRVASDGINVDSLFKSAVVQSKELGVNIHEVTNSLGEFARTYGEFSEAQLLAVNKTAVIMSNVSELSLEQASSNLVGTMNAFNIEAEQSIHIVDALNEVDNNYAISTMQLSDSLSKAGATARTFGLDMEDVMGHTTAVGAVTMESGDIIGNSLKTIYSRITTLGDSVDVLDSVGVSVKEMTESGLEMRGVNDILGDLAGKWTDLSDEQRQNIGVTIAGRNQLSRFLALMNNWQMAQDSTTAAINSTGSALKEQDIYMGSYEAKLNGVKTRFTELSLAIGEAFLSDGMFLAIQGIADLTEGLTSLVSKVGVLPIIATGLTLVGGKVSGLTGNLKDLFMLMKGGGGTFKEMFSLAFDTGKASEMFKGIRTEIGLIKGIFKDAGTGMAESFKAIGTGVAQSVGTMRTASVAINGTTVAQTGLGMATAGVSGAFTTAKTAVMGFLGTTAGIGIALAGVGFLIGKLVEKTIKAKQETKELMDAYEEANNKSVEAYNEHRTSFDKTVKDYNTLNEKINSGQDLGTDELEQYKKLTAEIAQIMPNAVKFVDANGQAHLKNADSIKKEAERTKQLAQEQAKMNVDKHAKAIAKTGESYEKLRKEASKYQNTIKAYERQKDAPVTDVSAYGGYDYYATAYTSIEQYQEAVAGAQKAQGAMSLELSKSSIEIGEYAKNSLEANGHMDKMTDTSLGLIDGFAKINQVVGDTEMSEKEYAKTQDELLESTKRFASSLADQYIELDKLGEKQSEKAKGMLDSVLSGLDDDFFKGDNVSGKLSMFTKSIQEIATNAESFDINNFQTQLQTAGFTSEEAKRMTMQLGVELENSAIKTAMASDELVAYNDTLADSTEKTWNAIDAKKTLMGLEDGEAQAIQSKLEFLTAKKELNEDIWLSDNRSQIFLDELVKEMGISKDTIVNNTREVYEAYKIMNEKGMFEINEMTTMSRDKLREANEGISESTLTILQDVLMNYRNFGGEIHDSMILAVSAGGAELESKVDEINKAFDKLGKSPKDSNMQANLFNRIKDDLKSIEGQYAIVADADGKFKIQMLNGEKSKYLDAVNTQLAEMGIEIDLMKDKTTNEDVFGFKMLDNTVYSLMATNTELENTNIATQLLRDNFVILQQSGYADETMNRWLTGIQTQFEFLGEEVKIVGEGTDDVKLALANGEDSQWLNVLNEQIKAFGGELVTVEDDAGNLIYTLKYGDGNELTLFTETTKEAQKAKESIKEVGKETDEVKEKASEGATLNVDVMLDPELQLKNQIEEKKEEAQDILVNDPITAPFEVDTNTFFEQTDEIDEKLETPRTMLIDIKMLEQADGSIETTQARIEGLLENIGSLESGVGQVISLIDNDLLGKNPLIQTLADKLNEIATAGFNAKKVIGELNALLDGTKFNITGEFKIDGLDGAEDKIKNLATAIDKSQSTIKTSVSNIQSTLNGLKIGKVDTSALTVLKNSVQSTMNEIRVILSNYGTVVTESIAVANNAMVFNTSGLGDYRTITISTINSIINSWNMLRGTLPNILSQTSMAMLQIYVAGTLAIDERTVWLQQNLSNRFGNIGETIRTQMVNISNIMVSEFKRGTSQLYSIASDIPRQIGAGISANMGSATSSLQALADNMVTRFKEALGIHSPSKVFEELGGFVIQGLTNGLSGGNLKDLGMNVFKDFGGGIFDSMEMIKAFVSGDFSGFGGGGGAGVERWRPLVMKALQMTGQLTPQNVELMLYQMMTESGGNPNAINNWDINAQNGDPSIGLMQVIGSTYRAHADPRWDKGQRDPLSSLLASIRYTLAQYGSLARGWRGTGYAEGGFINHRHIAEVGEEGQEVIIPLIEKRRKRGVDLWLQTAEKLGITNGLLPMFNRMSGYARGGQIGGFNIADGTSGESSASGEGNVGFVRPQTNDLLRAVKPVFSSNAEKTKLDSLYRRDTAGLKMDLTDSYLTKANQKLKTLNENTLAYRNQVLVIQRLNKTLLKQEKDQLSTTQKRQKVIEAELRKLKQTGKHTEAQRKKWNELNQEYDNNTKKIWKSEEAIDSLNNTIMQANYDNHIDYLNEIANKWQDIVDGINKTSSKLDFQLQKLQLTDETDVGGQLKIRYDMLEQQMKLEKTYQNQNKAFKKEYDSLVKKFGKNDKRTLEGKKLLDKSEEDYQKSILETLKMEKSIKDEREKVAKDSISALKTYYKQMEALSKNALAKEKENLKKAHDEKIKQYDEEISKINEVYDAKLKERDEEKNEKAYNEKMQEYNTERTELMQKISMASKDTSLEGRKKLADLQKQLLELNKEIGKAQEERADELWKKELDKQKEQQLEKIKDDKELENKEYEKQLDELEKREKEIMDYYKKMTSDETAWKEATDAWNKGDTSILTELMNQMQDGLSAIMGGDGSGILGGENLSEEDLRELLGDSMLDVSNIWLDIADQLKELNSINKNLDDLNANNQTGGKVKNPIFTNGGAKAPTTSQSNVAPDLKDKPSKGGGSKPSGIKGYHTVVRGDTLWDLAKKYYGNYYQWQKIQKANGGLNPYTLPIGKKLMIPFRSGGYTGDWFGEEGRVAMLHKKELVLNQNQTRDILDTVSVLDRAKSQMGAIIENTRRNRMSPELVGSSTNFGDINLYFDGFKGTHKEAEVVTKAIMDKLKKRR